MKDYFIKEISAETKFEPIERRNGVYVATFLLSETEDTRRIATARYAFKPTEEQVQSDFSEWKARHTALLLNSAKQRKLQEITAYNTSDNVDAFLLNGDKHWLTRDERSMAKLSTEARQRLGHYTTEQCLGGKFYTIPCDTLLTMLAYKKLPLSMSPAFESSSYIFVTVFGVAVFKEKLSVKKLAALALILSGIIVFTL